MLLSRPKHSSKLGKHQVTEALSILGLQEIV